ncbi:MAG: hypothetical protein AAGF01_20735 [Cyanobacteria bacterium P01_G01_bin.38]
MAKALQPLIQATEQTLGIAQSPDKRACTLVRIDSGGGTQADVNLLLNRGYFLLTKDDSTARARKAAKTVAQWMDDPCHSGRQVGLVSAPAPEYDHPVLRIAVRCRKNNGQWGKCS